MDSFYSLEELRDFGFRYFGENVKVSRKASIYGASEISLGSNVRIDDFAVLSGLIVIGSYVHIAARASLFAGDAGIEMEDFTCISGNTSIYAISDDYSGVYLTNPTVPEQYRGVTQKKVILKKHALVGTGCTVLPGVTIGEGASVGAMGLVTKDLEPWSVYVGIPTKKIANRSKQLLNLEAKLRKDNSKE